MKRILAIAFVFCLFASPALSADKKFFLEDDGTSTLRLEKVESKVADLEKRVTALEKSTLPPLKSIVNPLKASAPAVQYKTVRTQVCTNGVCRIVNQLVPLTDLEMAALPPGASASATAACPNCTTCADGCNCFGAGYYCADGKCPISLGSSAGASSTGDCASGSCGSSRSGRTGWYPGKLLGR